MVSKQFLKNAILSWVDGFVKAFYNYQTRNLFDYVYRTKLVSGGVSMCPLHDYIINLEHLRVAQAVSMILEIGVPKSSICQLLYQFCII